MHQSKLIELLRKLLSGQLGRFREFLCSPYFNKNEDNLLFFNYLGKYLASSDEKKLAKNEVLAKLKVSKPLDEKGLAYLMSQQLGLLEKFLATEQFLADDFVGGYIIPIIWLIIGMAIVIIPLMYPDTFRE